MRQALTNENKDLCDKNHRYVMRITGSDTEGQAELGNFLDPDAAVALAAADTYVVVLALTDMMTGVGLGIDALQKATPIISG